jgi:pimeloyl-ACP methyl ester carboxylesterase
MPTTPKKRTLIETINLDQKIELIKEFHEVRTKDNVSLIMSRKKLPQRKKVKAPILLIHGFAQNRFTWHLSGRSFENYLVSQSYDVYNLELRGHGMSRANGSTYPESFEAYLDYDVPAAIAAVKEISGVDKIFLAGHSLGASISYCIGARQPQDILGLISVGGPILFARQLYLMRALASVLKILHDNTLIKKFTIPNFPVDFIGFIIRKSFFYWDNPYFYFPYRVWYPRTIEREMLEERLFFGFDRTSFEVAKMFIKWAATGKYLSSDENVNYSEELKHFRAPILFIAGDRDQVVPATSIAREMELLGSPEKTYRHFGKPRHKIHYGHCDLICGRHAPEETWPCMLEWLETQGGYRA